MRSDNLYSLPEDLPMPEDDGACDHLHQARLPSLHLKATSGHTVDLSTEGCPWLVVYCYPRTGRPDEEPPGGLVAWNAIPGARGCTPQSCAYRDHFAELGSLGATIYGLSTQDSEYQQEVVQRLGLPFPLLSDAHLDFARALSLPTFIFAGRVLIKRLTIIARAGRIEKVRYPVFPSDSDAEKVITWLNSNSKGPSKTMP
ncbi:MAG: peroxiredoxin [Terriglobia bacterium]